MKKKIVSFRLLQKKSIIKHFFERTSMKKFLISQCTLLLLTFNGTMIGMHRIVKNLVPKKDSSTLNTITFTKAKKNNASETNTKSDENKQEYYILNNKFHGHEDKMAYYKQWQQP